MVMGKTKTHEEFVKEVLVEVGSEYSVIGQYQGANKKVEIKHNKCGYIWNVSANAFLRKSRCPKCTKSGKRSKTHEEFVDQVLSKFGDEFVFLDKYQRWDIKIKVIRKSCGHKHDVQPNNLLSGNGCPECNFTRRRKSHEKFVREVYELIGDEYTVVGKYTHSNTKVELLHNTCNRTFQVLSGSFVSSGSRCPHCKFDKKRKTQSQFVKDVFGLTGDEYTVLGQYVNATTDIEVTHNLCNKTFMTTPSKFLKGTRCIYCSSTAKKTTEKYKQEVFDLFGSEYEVLGEYTSSHGKLLMKHNECAYEWYVDASHFTSYKAGCPKCSRGKSKGENLISEILNKNNIKFTCQFRFNDCINKNTLPFDFALLNNKERLSLIIEYDGKQHFKPVEHWGGEVYLQQCQHNDQIKNTYCIENNIPLYRIPYWEFDNIESILDNIILHKNNGVDGDSFLVS